jgi:universal stress protein A
LNLIVSPRLHFSQYPAPVKLTAAESCDKVLLPFFQLGGLKEPDMLSIKKILCPVDFSGPSRQGLDYAFDLAALFQSELTVLYGLPVLPPRPTDPNVSFNVPEYEQILHKEAEEELDRLVSGRAPKTMNVRSLIRHGNPAKEIVRLAEEAKTELIVMATQGHSGWHNFVIGSVAEKVFHLASCPIFAVRKP